MAEGVADRALGLARKHEEKLRFLVVGVCNTAIGYALFALMLWIWGVQRYNFALVSGWVISVCVSYSTMKTFVFRTRGTNWLSELGRSYIVYFAALLVNLAVLNFFVKVVHLHPLVGQAASILIVTLMSYLGHKYFTFGKHAIESGASAGVFEPVDAEDPEDG